MCVYIHVCTVKCLGWGVYVYMDIHVCLYACVVFFLNNTQDIPPAPPKHQRTNTGAPHGAAERGAGDLCREIPGGRSAAGHDLLQAAVPEGGHSGYI